MTKLISKFLKQLIFCFTIFISFATQAHWHFTPQDVNALHNKPANLRIFYGRDSLQFGDLRLPEGKGPFPVAIIIHGGCWLSQFADLQNTSALSDALRDMGIATWNIEYRRIDNTGGGWPGTFLDIANATDYLRKIANQYSLDLNRVITIGHSAGGHLALWASMRHRISIGSELYIYQPLPIRGVIILGGVPDLKIFRSQGEKVCGTDVVEKLLGNSQDKMEQRYLQSSPAELIPSGVPQFFIYGKEDLAVPAEFAQDYVKKSNNAGDKVKLIEIENAAHHEYNVPNSVTWKAILFSVRKLISSQR